jgi:galactokinase
MLTDKILKIYKGTFPDGDLPTIVRSPGRVNVIGEHTDYNNGFVLPAAIDKAAYFAVSLRDDNEIHLYAHDLNEKFSIRVDELKPIGDISWPNYILGSVAQFQKENIKISGFNAVLTSDVPIGAGLSSSAAVECATAFALQQLLKTEFDRISLVRMAQMAEHEYAGVMCGIMDQFTSMMGKKDHVIKLDCRSLEFEYVPFKLDGVKVLLLNTNVKHSLASSEYNTRRKECDTAVEWVRKEVKGIDSLRDVSEKMLNKYVLPKDKLIDMRSRFVIQENERLLSGCEDLKRGDLWSLGRIMYATHDGLSKMYEVSCKELDWLVDFVKDNDAVLGARMMGGGFGGCTINLVKQDQIENLITSIMPAYEKVMGLPLSYYIASIEGGTQIVSPMEYSHV